MRHLFHRLFHRCGAALIVVGLSVASARADFATGCLGSGGAFDIPPESTTPMDSKSDATIAALKQQIETLRAAVMKAPAAKPAVPLRNAINATNTGCANGKCGR